MSSDQIENRATNDPYIKDLGDSLANMQAWHEFSMRDRQQVSGFDRMLQVELGIFVSNVSSDDIVPVGHAANAFASRRANNRLDVLEHRPVIVLEKGADIGELGVIEKEAIKEARLRHSRGRSTPVPTGYEHTAPVRKTDTLIDEIAGQFGADRARLDAVQRTKHRDALFWRQVIIYAEGRVPSPRKHPYILGDIALSQVAEVYPEIRTLTRLEMLLRHVGFHAAGDGVELALSAHGQRLQGTTWGASYMDTLKKKEKES